MGGLYDAATLRAPMPAVGPLDQQIRAIVRQTQRRRRLHDSSTRLLPCGCLPKRVQSGHAGHGGIGRWCNNRGRRSARKRRRRTRVGATSSRNFREDRRAGKTRPDVRPNRCIAQLASHSEISKAGSTLRSSRAVPHPSTNRALRRLTSEVGRDPVHSTRYGRQRVAGEGSVIQMLMRRYAPGWRMAIEVFGCWVLLLSVGMPVCVCLRLAVRLLVCQSVDRFVCRMV